jgi:excisionase family DNA binding protein
VRELERERVTVQEAARQLGITESAVRKRAARRQIRSVKVTEGKRERLYILLDIDQDRVPEPFRERYMKSLEDRVRTLEDEVYRQQAIILSMSQSMQALTGASETPREDAPESPESEASRVPSDAPTDAGGGPQEPSERPEERSWWRRMFGGA